jgi:hypothetical protein
MSAKFSLAPFAITSGGRVLLNLIGFDVPPDPRAIMELGLSEPGRLFVGIELTPCELASARERLGHGFDEAAAFAAGRRQRLRKARRE